MRMVFRIWIGIRTDRIPKIKQYGCLHDSVQIFVNDRGDVFDSHVVTFDEIELKPRAKD